MLDFALHYFVQFGETVENDNQSLAKKIDREGLAEQQRGSVNSLQMLADTMKGIIFPLISQLKLLLLY